MTKARSHQLDIYGAWLHVARTERAWTKLRKRIDSLPDIDDGSLGFTAREVEDDGTTHLAVFLDAARLAGNHVGTAEIVAHEAAHAAGMLLDHIGQDYDGESEAFAYLVGWMAAWMWGVVEA